MAVAVSLLSKFRGCLIGSHVGDCLGAPFEGDVPVSKTVLAKFITNALSDQGENAQILPYTDDTAMGLNLGRSLVEKKSFQALDMSKRFVDEYISHPRRGYGAHVVQVFQALAESNFEDVFGPARLQFGGSGSYGNGAAMRIAPAALYTYNKSNEMIQVVKGSSLITHTHQNGYNGAILQSLAIDQALRITSPTLVDPVLFVNNLLTKMESIEQPVTNVRSFENEKPFCNRLKKMIDMFDKGPAKYSPEVVADKLGNYISAHESVPAAIYSFLRGLQPLEEFESDNPFVRTMFFAIAIGGDTDTIAAMAGSIAGAYHGKEMIPEKLQQKCESIGKSDQLSEELYTMCCGS